MFEREVLYCHACGDLCRPGEFIYWCDPFTGQELPAGGEPFHDECVPGTAFYEDQESYNLAEEEHDYGTESMSNFDT
jgi:hypothetical protein